MVLGLLCDKFNGFERQELNISRIIGNGGLKPFFSIS